MFKFYRHYIRYAVAALATIGFGINLNDDRAYKAGDNFFRCQESPRKRAHPGGQGFLMRLRRVGSVVVVAVMVYGVASTAWAQTSAGVDEFGTASDDFAGDVVLAGDGSVYMAGQTSGQLPGNTAQGNFDAYLRKYDATGHEMWTRQFGTSVRNDIGGLAVSSSDVYVVGDSYPGVFAGKFDADGNSLWSLEFRSDQVIYGQTGLAMSAGGVAADGSGMYVVGDTEGVLPGQSHIGDVQAADAFIRKYDTDGNELWTRQFGTDAEDSASAVAVDATGVYVVGQTWGAFPDFTKSWEYEEAFVRKYDTEGNELWTRQFTTVVAGGRAHANDVAVRDGHVYVVGETHGALAGQASAGQPDAFVRAYDTDGNALWTRQFGGPSVDFVAGAGAYNGGVIVGGETWSGLNGQPTGGESFVRRYDSDGNIVWTRQFGDGNVRDVAGDATIAFVAGDTSRSLLGGSYTGGADSFLLRIVEGPDVDVTPPVITCDAPPTFFVNDTGLTRVTATVSDTDSGALSTRPSRDVPTGAIGLQSAAFTAGDWAGNLSSTSCPYYVAYYVWYLAPATATAGPPVVNTAKAGSIVPITWYAWGSNAPITNPAHFKGISVRPVPCDMSAQTNPINAVKKTGLSDLGQGAWQYGWKSNGSLKKTCQEVTLLLDDGQPGRTALYDFQ